MSKFDTRLCDQEPDAITDLAAVPGYIVVGTYSLVSDTDCEATSASLGLSDGRRGSIQILPFSPDTKDAPKSRPNLSLDRKDFAFGVYDLQLHPVHTSLLGVATSNAEILFFYVLPQHDGTGALQAVRLAEIGKIQIEEPHEQDGKLSIVTQFQFLVQEKTIEASAKSDHYNILLAATTQFGNTKIVNTTIPSVSNINRGLQDLECQILNIHKQSMDLEAWTVLPIFTSPSTLYIISGGDDSQLIISNVETSASGSFFDEAPDLDIVTSNRVLTDKRTHQAGVVFICTLGHYPSQERTTPDVARQTDDTTQYMILTGSYDDYLRLFCLTPPSASRPKAQLALLSEIHLGGGVWRILLLDEYDTSAGKDYILLIAAHTAGACIVRLSASQTEREGWGFTFKVEKWFTEGHESLVYAVTAERDVKNKSTWKVISASFYDKRLCNWEWTDDQRSSHT